MGKYFEKVIILQDHNHCLPKDGILKFVSNLSIFLLVGHIFVWHQWHIANKWVCICKHWEVVATEDTGKTLPKAKKDNLLFS
jgi:hypothetical protein